MNTVTRSASASRERKVALVFGGSRGIGAAVAARLASDGFAVALTYVSRPDSADQVVSGIVANGGQALAIEADSADPVAIRSAVAAAVAQFGSIDVLVVNAGIARFGAVDEFALEDLDKMLAVNVRGVFLAIQAAVKHMREGGRVITIGSIASYGPGIVGSSVYAMTKAAVATMIRGVALDLAARGITANNIQPGPIETDMTAEMIPHLIEKSPLRRLGKPREIAALISYLASDQSGYMTGSSLTIDGGYVL